MTQQGPALSGGLLSSDYLAGASPPPACTPARIRAYRGLRRDARIVLGPAASPRQIAASVARPLAEWLGWTTVEHDAAPGSPLIVSCVAPRAGPIPLLVIATTAPTDPASRAASRAALVAGVHWAFVTNGLVLRIVHALREGGRGIACIDLEAADPHSLAWLAHLAGPAAFEGSGGLDALVAASDAHGVRVCRSLRIGVTEALGQITASVHDAARRRGGVSLQRSYAEALTAVYRILFLLFAEARRLVPMWHPVYRDAYSVDALRRRLAGKHAPIGTWAALQAMARLAHAGCEAGDLHVTPFNGRLFSPARAPLLDHLDLDDTRVAQSLAALLFTSGTGRGLQHIAYAELGVEELGSVYENLLDLEPGSEPGPGGAPAVHLAPTGRARKTSGTFYTPRPLTDHLVAATLAPLVRGRAPESILRLRVLDPAMGSGAFLVAALRYLTAAWETATLARGDASAGEISERDRLPVRRTIAARCLFGVDRNPMAVQLAQLSLWLATLGADRPLSFLDHHLIAGDSLIGASPLDVLTRAPGRTFRGPLPLESLFDWSEALAAVRPVRLTLEEEPDDRAETVRRKEASLAALDRDDELSRWKSACDLWCTAWLPGAVDPALYHALLDRTLGRLPHGAVPGLDAALDTARRRGADLRCVHWPLAFPEVLLDEQGRPARDGGFDAVIGNPPWEMLRADSGRVTASEDGAALVRFARRSGLYRAQGRGHANLYQLFVERALSLTRPGGRLGLVVPSGLLSDDGPAPLRRALIATADLDAITVFDNRHGLFPIHRSVRFAALTATRGGPTRAIRCRFRVDDPASVDSVPPVVLTPAALQRLSGPGLEIPELPTPDDLRIVEALTARHPALASPEGWGAAFARELNATDDRDCFTPDGSLAVVEGKHLLPFRVDLGGVRLRADADRTAQRLGVRSRIGEPRLAYRDVAAASNRLTLIAAIVPAGAVTVHTAFCLRTRLSMRDQRVLMALLNSYAANYLVRCRVTTHVSLGIVSRLPVPVVRAGDPLFDALSDAAAVMERGGSDEAAATVQALAAEAYGIAPEDFEHVLASFPLVPPAERERALACFRRRTPPQSCR
ncbi:MAG TPA: N-6 DNA methylase [Vicinamibacterales bacterium]